MKANWLNWPISLYSSTVIFVIREREKYIRYILQCHGLGYNPDAVLPAWSTPKGCSGPLNPNPSMERVWARRLVHMHWGAVICDDSVGLPIDPRRSGAESSPSSSSSTTRMEYSAVQLTNQNAPFMYSTASKAEPLKLKNESRLGNECLSRSLAYFKLFIKMWDGNDEHHANVLSVYISCLLKQSWWVFIIITRVMRSLMLYQNLSADRYWLSLPG